MQSARLRLWNQGTFPLLRMAVARSAVNQNKETRHETLHFATVLLGLSLTIVGCEASGKVTDDDSDNGARGRVEVGD